MRKRHFKAQVVWIVFDSLYNSHHSDFVNFTIPPKFTWLYKNLIYKVLVTF